MPHILGVEVRHKTAKTAIDKAGDGMVSMRNSIGQDIYACCVRGSFYGEPSNMHIYLDPTLAEARRSDLYRTVQAQEERLAQLEQLTKREAERLGTFLDIDLGKDGTFTFERSYQRRGDSRDGKDKGSPRLRRQEADESGNEDPAPSP
jgi:hypothetical protein